MRSIRVEAVVQEDGEIRLSDLPCRKGDRVKAIVWLPECDDADARQRARERFLARARASRLYSAGAYPSRGELHDHH
ncbi:MAG TPA: hypothetical protein PK184_01045 [Phycisphaerae bacterium]|jgi:hypothetical protein|nr:hypothetical protein [Phycisphaerae bacterium]HOL25513.1 hypothetical protein [Phycisphaerae bacterium]HPP19810.1 hypothetical protein [Phycisphaerae bacterium]HPU31264.1 hypothetical protein [Phycisphaerae bacterium]HXK84939.1 hypothetical protein [Phycisphaerae bacterium]